MRGVQIFDRVRIIRSPETIAAGYAELSGVFHGFTTPSITGVEVIGPGQDDHALGIYFADGTTAWFDPSLVAFVDENTDES